jgi:hypothetical protein
MSEKKAGPASLALMGVALVIAAPVFLVQNERDSFRRITAPKVGEGVVVTVGGARAERANQGALAHVQGDGQGDADPVDDDLGITSPNSLMLDRKAEMYQWEVEAVEVEEDDGSTHTEYEYHAVWSDKVIDSRGFAGGHDTPTSSPTTATGTTAPTPAGGVLAQLRGARRAEGPEGTAGHPGRGGGRQ